MASKHEDIPRTRIRHVQSTNEEGELKDIEEILPFLRDAKDRRKRSLASGSDSPSEAKIDPTRMPKVMLGLFGIFIVGSQIQSILFGSSVDEEVMSSVQNRINDRSEPLDLPPKISDEDGDESDEFSGNFTETSEGEKSFRGIEDLTFELPIVESLPSELDYYASVLDPLEPGDIAVLFHIPRTGGSTLKEITAQCLNLVQASEIGPVVNPAASTSNELVVLEEMMHGGRYVNVDTTWPGGLERAKNLNLASSGLVDIIVTPYFFQAGTLMDANHRGRLFTMLRHPIDRAVSLYHYMNELALNGDESMKRSLNGMTLDEYAASSLVENNWITRFVTNTLGGELTPQHEALARKVLADKFIIGLLSDRQQSLERFIQFFGWKVEGDKAEDCIDRRMGWDWANEGHIYPKVKEGSKTWNLLEEANSFDIRLFEYAQELYRMQAVIFASSV